MSPTRSVEGLLVMRCVERARERVCARHDTALLGVVTGVSGNDGAKPRASRRSAQHAVADNPMMPIQGPHVTEVDAGRGDWIGK